MDTDGSKQVTAARPARVELVDNWSDRWTQTLDMLQTLGQRDVLHVDDEGWLPARQNLLVAFSGTRPIGYLCFHVQPGLKDGAVVTEAIVDGEGTLEGDRALARQLREAAMHRALELRCARFRWEQREEAGV
jgi:hypothetical protein